MPPRTREERDRFLRECLAQQAGERHRLRRERLMQPIFAANRDPNREPRRVLLGGREIRQSEMQLSPQRERQEILDDIQRRGLVTLEMPETTISLGSGTEIPTTAPLPETRPMTPEEYVRRGYEPQPRPEQIIATGQSHEFQFNQNANAWRDILDDVSRIEGFCYPDTVRVEGVQKAKKRLEPRRRALPA